MNNMKLVNKENHLEMYKLKPNIFNPFYGNLRKIDLHERIRFFISLINGYEIYYLYINKQEAGYCVIQNGGGYRYKFVGKKDIIIGPIFVTGTFRRKGYATYMLNKVLYEFEMPYKYAYCFVQKSNVASKKTFSGLGFLKYSDAKYSKYLRKLETCDSKQGDFIIYRFERNKNLGRNHENANIIN